MTRRRSRKRRAGTASPIQVILTVVAIVGVVAALAAVFWFANEKESALMALDRNTFCPKSGPTSETAILVDRTDPLTDIQGEALEREILALANEVPKHGVLNIYEVGVGGSLLNPVVSVCNPGDGTDVSSLDDNPKFWKQRYEQKFVSPIKLMLSQMRLDIEASTSPIMEAVQAIAVRDFGSGSTVERKRLVVISDLLQHVKDFSLYQGVPDFNAFWRGGYGASVRSDLADVHVTIELLHRRAAASRQTDALGKFWLDWFQAQGAVIDAFKNVAG